MSHAVSYLSNRVYNQLPKIKIDTAENVFRKASQLALPIIMLCGAELFERAEAFLSCAICGACLVMANPGCVIPCVICGVLLPLPVHVMVPGNSTLPC